MSRAPRLQPEKAGDPDYRQIWRVVDGAVRATFEAHPEYLAPKASVRTVRNSIVKRVTGAIHGYAEQSAWGRSGSSPAAERAGAARTDPAGGAAYTSASAALIADEAGAAATVPAPPPSKAAEGSSPITPDWLAEVGFRWHQLDRQPERHWLLWLGPSVRASDGSLTSVEDIGIELAPASGRDGQWFCWFRSDAGGRYSRFLHLRMLRTQGEVIVIVEALTGLPWRPADHRFGACLSSAEAEQMRENDARVDRKLIAAGHRWREIEHDDTRGRALPEHMEFHATGTAR